MGFGGVWIGAVFGGVVGTRRVVWIGGVEVVGDIDGQRRRLEAV